MNKILLGLAFSLLASAAVAAEAPVAAMAPADAAIASGWYVSGDAAWESVNLPDYNLGFHKVSNPTFLDAGTFATLDQHIDGYVVQAAVGYFLPASYSDTLMGVNTRVEFGGLYGRATGSQSGAASFTDGGVVSQFLDGSGAGGGYVCSPGQVCATNLAVSTEHTHWQLNAKIAGDYSISSLLVTPSVVLFGGSTKTGQVLNQGLLLGVHPEVLTYTADTSLRSTDFGARVGVDLKFDVTPQVVLGLGGSAGLASRHASFDGSDLGTDILLGSLNGASATSGSDNATPFVANAEAGVAYKCLPALTLRGFAGLNFDSKVAGVEAASFAGSVGAVTSSTPAHVTFHSEVSYYVGSGATWTF